MKRHEEDMKMATKHIRAEFYINILKKMKIKSHMRITTLVSEWLNLKDDNECW